MARERRLQSHSGAIRLTADGAAKTVCVGHRGARAFAPENTLPAFRKAAAMGCAAVELDVHLSRDGEPVVHHDERLARCTDVGQRFPGRDDRLAGFTLAELRTLDAGGWYAAELTRPAEQRQPFLRSLGAAEIDRHLAPAERAEYAGGSVRIPTLAEVLQLARALDLIVNVEIKSPAGPDGGGPQQPADGRLARAVVERVVAMDMRQSVIVSSFDHAQLAAVRALDAGMPTGVLTGSRIERPADCMRQLDADAYHPGLDALGFGTSASAPAAPGSRDIGEVRAAGGRVFVWTCNQVAQMKALIAAGVTGVITDYPNRFADALN